MPFVPYTAVLDARFSHLQAYVCQRLPTLQRGLSAIAYLLVLCSMLHFQPELKS